MMALEAMCAQAAVGPDGAEVIAPANFNAPGQIVVAGHTAAVARLGELVTAAKGRAMPVKVSAPFHCALMAPAARVVEAELGRATVKPLRFPVVANFDARPNTDPGRARELLVSQVVGAVRWEESMRFMAEHGVTHALEIGPGKVLANLMKRIAKDVKVLSVNDVASVAQVSSFLAEAAA
jgi:[acyl-carrier-protein] S-malonyltransferase